MAKRMLIDTTHPEETRVVVLDGTRLEEFDFETSTKKQVKGNIYLAKVTRVEPSLQAAFVEYGGNRHGFLAFSEIHPDYYRIPVADRKSVEGSQTLEPAASDAMEESDDEDGVPIADALPVSPVVAETTPKLEAPTRDEASGVAESATRDDATTRPDTKAEPPGDPRLEGAPPGVPGARHLSEEEAIPATGPEAAQSGETGSIPTSSALPLLDAQPDTAPGIAVRDRAAASIRDEVLAAPQNAVTGWETTPTLSSPAAAGLGPESGREGELLVTAGAPAPSEADPRVSPLIGPGYAVDGQVEPRDWLQREQRESDVPEARDETDVLREAVAADTGNRESEAPGHALRVDNGDSEAAEPSFPDDGGSGESDLIDHGRSTNGEDGDSEVIETLGGDEFEEVETQRSRAQRHYKIQEVVRRRQIMLVQVTKEERGTKGAALTTYLSLAGRYCVLMPNTARGGGVSRKITNLSDRRRLKTILEELEIPEGMGVIVRTAGAERSKAEIKRDYEYLLRLWNEIRELTLRSTAPALIYEEGDLIKRSIRDLYARDIDEVLVEGEDGYRSAKAFMKMLMPSHAKRVQPYRDPQIGLLHRFQVESQIDAIHSPVVQLRSGGYVVIDQTEALVAIDVNSGRATRERNIEETALRTNLEAAEEIARQLRLRDLAGLIVIDFIDMEEHRNQAAVERRLKEALRNDRARIQVGRISPFGLLEMSRQRLRSSLAEASTQPCPHCGGTGFIRSTESTALYVLRSIEEEGMRRRSAEVCVYVPTTVALYILNHKRDSLAQLETRYGIHVLVARDDTLIPPAFRLERLRAVEPSEAAAIVSPPLTQTPDIDEDGTEEFDETSEAESAEPSGHDGEEERMRARRRRRRRRRQDDERRRAPTAAADDADDAADGPLIPALASGDEQAEGDADGEGERLRRRRGRRGSRRRGGRDDRPAAVTDIGRPAAENIEIVAMDNDQREEGRYVSAEIAAVAPPTEGMPSPVPGSAGEQIETASLPALAGEHGPGTLLLSEPARTSPEAVTAGDQRPEPYVPLGGEPGSDGGNRPAEAFDRATSAASAEAMPPDEQHSMPLWATIEPEHGTQPAAGQSAPPSEMEPKEIVQEVTKKPENPRRGWWQRLIQS